MNLTVGIALIAVAIVMIVLGRASDGVARGFLKVWIVGQIYAMTAMVLGVAGVAFIVVNWPF